MDTWMGINDDPITLHKYLYTANDPINLIDPSGNSPLSELLTGINLGSKVLVQSVVNIGRSSLSSLNRALMKTGSKFKKGFKKKKGKNADEVPTSLRQWGVMLEARSGVGRPIIGPGTGKILKDTPRLEALYGPGLWVKMKHERTFDSGFRGKGKSRRKTKVVIHYFRNVDTLEGVEFKFKNRGV